MERKTLMTRITRPDGSCLYELTLSKSYEVHRSARLLLSRFPTPFCSDRSTKESAEKDTQRKVLIRTNSRTYGSVRAKA
jgi:hypothetical protein